MVKLVLPEDCMVLCHFIRETCINLTHCIAKLLHNLFFRPPAYSYFSVIYCTFSMHDTPTSSWQLVGTSQTPPLWGRGRSNYQLCAHETRMYCWLVVNFNTVTLPDPALPKAASCETVAHARDKDVLLVSITPPSKGLRATHETPPYR